MNYRFILFIIFFCGSVQAQNKSSFLNAVIFQHDGTQIDCLARLPYMSEKTIRFKIDQKSKTQKIKSDNVKTVCYYLRGEKILEIEYLRYVSFFEINDNRQTVFAPEWIEVLVRGQMMLYVIQETSSWSGQRKSNVYHYYVKRENEELATEIAYVRYKNDFLIYRMETGDYFANVPEIEKKIANREEGYTAKDIIDIVKEYNNFQSANKM